MSQKDPGPLPARWLNCPRKAGGMIADKFLAFKTPLGPQFNDKVPEANRFTPSMLFAYLKGLKVKIGLWVDLTNTSRFYDKREIEQMECKYVKLSCRGHGETPNVEQTKEFIQLVSKFLSQKPLEVIGVHCTHGFNRTGFLLVSYMVEQLDCSLEAALKEFASMRPPGIYKQDYLEELYKRYDMVEYTPPAPPRPDWCNEEEEEEIDYDDDDAPTNSQNSSNNGGRKKGKRENNRKKTIFMPEVRGVEPFDVQPRLSQIQKKAQDFCDWRSTGFPGSQPVSMDMGNIMKLHEKPYRVSWKADGVRYMMMIDGKGEVYMLDRDNCAFKVNGMQFLHSKDLKRHLKNTLLDGEMVVDKLSNGEQKARYLCYDIIKFEGQDVGKARFYPVRLTCIQNEIVNPRHEAMKQGIIHKENEPFSISLKQFWDLTMARKLLGEKFAKTLLHEPDGLIFQPSNEPYVAGACEDVLKWKPGHMNSVDFKLKIVTEHGEGILQKKMGHLFVGQLNRPFAAMKLTKELKALNNKIIECKFENNQWVYMRERTDKSYPNSYNTAMAVCGSIKDPVTKEILLDFIDHERFHDDSDVMPPPKRVCR